MSLAASFVISCGMAGALSLAASGGSASRVEDATSGLDVELTDSGGSGSLILDGEEGTDVGVAAAADWLKRITVQARSLRPSTRPSVRIETDGGFFGKMRAPRTNMSAVTAMGPFAAFEDGPARSGGLVWGRAWNGR